MLEAQVIFNDLMKKEFKYSQVAMLQSIAYSMSGDKSTSDKYRAISNIHVMREKGEFQMKGEGRKTQQPVSSVLAPLTKAMNASLVSLSGGEES
jgi:hypothetical protein